MRIGIAGFGHETVTFWPGRTELAAFERIALLGDHIIDARRGTNTVLGGVIDMCNKRGISVVPVCDVEVEASAPVSDEAFRFYNDMICETFAERAGQLDGVLLYLHGAMVTEGDLDPETSIVENVRKIVGRQTPIVVAFDLHGNLTPSLLETANAAVSYRSSPHIDMRSTGERAASLLFGMLEGSSKPVCVMAKPGVAVPSVFSATTAPPGKDIIRRVLEWQHKPDVLDVSFLFGFAWSDVPGIGCSAIAVTDNNRALAEEIVKDLSGLAWEKRGELTGKGNKGLYTVENGVARAVAVSKHSKRPVFVLDHADRTNDTTFVLEELIKQKAENAAVPLFRDPEAVKACHSAGKGGEVSLEVGAETGWRDNRPIPFTGKVEWIGDGVYAGTGPMTAGAAVDLGPAAIVRGEGVWLQLVSEHAVLMDTDPFIQFGYKPEEFSIIVSKSKTHFRAVYETLAEEIIIVDAPGQCPANLDVFTYHHVPDGVYPIRRS